jgi:hypothetical protein
MSPGEGFEVRAVVSKRGVDDGNQKGGGFLQPAQESLIYYNSKKIKRKQNFKISQNFFYAKVFLTMFPFSYITWTRHNHEF